MKRSSKWAAALDAVLAARGAGVGVARAWEATTTNAGLTEAAALGSHLHARLADSWGLELGLYAPLTVPRASAPTLFQRLALLEPSEGYVPDARGRQSALAWLVAGSVIEEVPGERGRHHFYDPVHKTGLTGKGANAGGFFRRLSGTAQSLQTTGVAAPDWIASKDNDLGMARFLTEQEAAVAAATPAEREEHLAYALLCAGAMSAVLEDVGSPSRARDDLGEHLSPLGGGSSDRGSRFERVAALAYGRVGVTPAGNQVARTKARDFFTSADGKGLADVTNAHWYSSGTLPSSLLVPKAPKPGELAKRAAVTQRFPLPAPEGELDLAGAAHGGAQLHDKNGVCLADYRFEEQTLSWWISDECAADQAGAILPNVAAYAAGFLDFLFRGELVVDEGGVVKVGNVALGAGTLTAFAEDASGKRSPVAGGAVKVAGGAAGATLSTVAAAAGGKLIVVFRGKDAAGEDLVAAGRSK
jgi:hypothetical protein